MTKIATQIFDYFCVLDFESTGDRPQPDIREVIELPAILLDAQTGTAIDEFHYYIRPRFPPQLTAYCIELTGIQQAWVDGTVFQDGTGADAGGGGEGRVGEEEAETGRGGGAGGGGETAAAAGGGGADAPPWVGARWSADFGQVLRAFDVWLRGHVGQDLSCVLVITLGDWDLDIMLPKQARLSDVPRESIGIHLTRWCNVKEVFQMCFPHITRIGMLGMLEALELPHIGHHHCGIDDCRNIAAITRWHLHRGHVFNVTKSNVGSWGKPAKRPRRR
jgi:inhibitor of KinA sporulation pathway (predicted exonuclease)